jgi:hypothetical protein
MEMKERLGALIADGLTIGECLRAFAADDNDPYVKAARQKATDTIEIDAQAVTSVGDDGAWVTAWVWVSNAQAGLEEAP